MRKRMMLLLLLLGICACAFLVGRRLAATQIASRSRPFVIEMQENLTSGDNPAQSRGEYHFFNAVRGDGSHVYGNIAKRPDGSWQILSRRVELVSERKFALTSDLSQFVSTFPMRAARAAQLEYTWGRTNCVPKKYQLVGEDFIQGYGVLKVERNEATARWQRWVSPDLACHDLRAHVEFKRLDGTIQTINDQTAVLIREGEPPAELFDVSRNFVEVVPSRMFLRGAPLQTAPEDLQKKLGRVDEAYQNLRRNPPQ